MTQYGAWASYSGSAKIVLALVLLAATGGVTYAATRAATTATTLDTYGHIWPDRDESTSAAVDTVITARTEPGRNSGDTIKQRRRSGLV
jgi:hypothetical protein